MRRPNILLLYTDQLRWNALGANGTGEIKTPNLDALARTGVNFSHHFVQSPPALQGESLADVVRHGEEPHRGVALTKGNGWKCLRTPGYRYLIHADGREGLWDIESDPGEYHDVAADTQYQTALSDCRQLMLRRLLEIERPLPRTWVY